MDEISSSTQADELIKEDGETSGLSAPYRCIDHIALAIADIERAIALFQNVLRFELKRRRHIEGARTCPPFVASAPIRYRRRTSWHERPTVAHWLHTIATRRA